MKKNFIECAVCLVACTLFHPIYAATQPASKMGYLYPAGGKRGTTFTVLIGGQRLRGAEAVLISGTGVTAKIIDHCFNLKNLQAPSKKLLKELARKVRDKRMAEFKGTSKISDKLDLSSFIESELKKQDEPSKKRSKQMLAHPVLNDLENKSFRDLAHMVNAVYFPRRMLQLNPQLSDIIQVEVTIAPNAELGNRELRLTGKGKITAPMKFQIGSHAEHLEKEPNNKAAFESVTRLLKLKWNDKLPKEHPLELPIVLNGQIMPGDIDRFRFKAKGGEKLVISAEARSLIPFLADAVPGWFQATMALYDSKGKKIAYADDFQFHPDPVLFFEIPKAGEYELEIRDSIYRGREDFVYRVIVGETPFITSIFPLGTELSKTTTATINGWNLPSSKFSLRAPPGEAIREAHLKYNEGITNPVSYMVDPLPAIREKTGALTPFNAQPVSLPVIIDGNISDSQDKDIYSFTAVKGDKVTLEVYARRLNSPLDSIVKLIDSSGAVIAVNDDHVLKDSHLHKDILGVVTHHADSYLTTEIPKDGTYYVHIADSRRHGSTAHNYRLRISEPRPDFALRTTPSSISIRPGAIIPIDIHVLRKDGFNEEIKLSFTDERGFTIHHPVIPAGCNKFTTTIRGPKKGSKEPFTVSLCGEAESMGAKIVRTAIPADDTMQAFLFRHLVPAKQFMAVVPPQKWTFPDIVVTSEQNLNKIKAGDTIKFSALIRRKLVFEELILELKNAPDGLTITPTTMKNKVLEFEIKVDDKSELNTHCNLIIEVFKEGKTKKKEGKPQKKFKRTLGFLPAIPVTFVNKAEGQ